MIKSLSLLTAVPLIAAKDTGYEAISEVLTFESVEPEQSLDRLRILAELQGGVVKERSSGRPIARRLRRVKKADVEGKESLRDLNAPLVSLLLFSAATISSLSENSMTHIHYNVFLHLTETSKIASPPNNTFPRRIQITPITPAT